MRDGLSRGLLETILSLVGITLIVGDSVASTVVHNGFTDGIALIAASATSFGLRYTRPSGKDPE